MCFSTVIKTNNVCHFCAVVRHSTYEIDLRHLFGYLYVRNNLSCIKCRCKRKYFTINAIFLIAVAIANTLTKYITIQVKKVWSRCMQDQKENRKLSFYSMNALLLTDLVHLLALSTKCTGGFRTFDHTK